MANLCCKLVAVQLTCCSAMVTAAPEKSFMSVNGAKLAFTLALPPHVQLAASMEHRASDRLRHSSWA